jgi:hypothetical protein
MNPAKHALTTAEQIARATMIARTLGVAPASGYLRRNLGRVDQLTALQAIQKALGTHTAAQVMCAVGWTIDAACLTLLGPDGLERHLNRMILQ